tara:strand:- start:348 stop:644 length:297 start_codon:yes stop_codon:yes gene_type:complete
LGLKVVFKYTRRNTAIRVFSVIYFKHSIVKTIKADHLKIKARYKFKASLFGLLAIYRTAAKANKYPKKMGCTNIGNRAIEIIRPAADNQLCLRILILT